MKEEMLNVFDSFSKEMNEWEVSYYNSRQNDRSGDKTSFREKLDAIFNKYCTSKERKYGRQVAMSVSFPPDYDPENDEILDVEVIKNKATVIVQKHTGFKNKYRYTLHFKNNEWRIDKKEWFDDKWKQDYL
ncbi:TPA: NTF2 fold immunity protein [Escherichia coli]|nr:NTF2 fold immunity protein [Escherichia coli]GCW61474.1 Immunity protein RhsIA [Escherichia coli]GCZ76257.1 Immunity protein RhsIA [Escherichia coli]